jgi:hypothetical protein
MPVYTVYALSVKRKNEADLMRGNQEHFVSRHQVWWPNDHWAKLALFAFGE